MANKRKRDPLNADPMYRVWRDDESEEDGREYGALDVACAAQLYASWCHAHRDGWEWSWPVIFHVKVDTTGEVFVVEVSREMVPEFVAGKPQPLAMPAANHVLWGSEPLCHDVRLRGAPGSWPGGQTWISLADIANDEQAIAVVTCEVCKRRAPGHVTGIKQAMKDAVECQVEQATKVRSP